MKRLIAGLYLCIMAGLSMGANLVWDITPLEPTIFGNGHTESRGWSINNNKQVVGEVWGIVDNVQTEHIPAVWDFSEPDSLGISHTMVTEIPSMYLKWPFFLEINEQGQVCGQYIYAYPGEENYWSLFTRPMIYNIHDRSVRDLGCLGDDEEDAPFLDYYQDCYSGNGRGINNAGTVVGGSAPGATNVWGRREAGFRVPTFWMGGGDPVEALGEHGGWLEKINNQNLMIGGYMPEGSWGPERAFKQTGSSRTMLPMPSGREAWSSTARGLNDQNMIVGYIWPGYSNNEAILWHPELGIVQLPACAGYDSAEAHAINNYGTIVGFSNGAVVWLGEGTNYQVINLDMFAAQSGWQLMIAYDINDDGWIVGHGRFDGHDMGFLARPRLDENPPLANLDSDNIKNEDGEVRFTVLYYDDNGMNETSLDDHDIQVIYPDGTVAAAALISIEEVEPEPETGKRKYEARYSFTTPPINPMRTTATTLRIEIAESEVSDMSGRYVKKGLIGELEMTFPSSTATIIKGSRLDLQTSTTTWTFETHLYTGPVDPIFQVLGLQFQTPGSSTWRTMTSTGDGDWKYVQTAAQSSALSAFGDGDYTYRITLDFGGPFDMDMTFRFGMDADGSIIAAPASSPSIVYPQQGSTISGKNIVPTWAQPTDPSITSIICLIVDTASGDEVFSEVIPNGTAGSAKMTTLLPGHQYDMTVYFCSGDHNVLEEDDWTSYKLKYTSTKVSFFTQQLVGDLNNDGAVDMKDLSLLSAHWKKTSSQAGWKAPYDLQPNGAIDIGDLAAMAQHWLE